jgi:CubicO group peptidase (beta-lactamase class C family)
MTGTAIPRTSPGAQGVSIPSLLRFIGQVERHGVELHSFMLARHGAIVAECWWHPYACNLPHVLYSLSKSFTSTAAGLLQTEGRLDLDAKVVSFFPDELPAEPSANLNAMCVRDLLMMGTGHDVDTLGPITAYGVENWVGAFLAQPVPHKPGAHFVYNSGATYMVAAIVQKIVGTTLLDYLTPRLLEPLGISGAVWDQCPRGINTGGWGLSIKTEDIMRFGLLYLNQGMWQGKRILPVEWVNEATCKQISNGDDTDSDWCQGYGYQFWRSRHNCYRGDGAFGQYCIVMPEHDAVIAITAGQGDMQKVLNLVWDCLLPGFSNKQTHDGPAELNKLTTLLKSLSLASPRGDVASPIAEEVSGKAYDFPENDQKLRSVEVDFEPKFTAITIRDDNGDHRILCGLNGNWLSGVSRLDNKSDRPISATGAWTARNTFIARVAFTTTPYGAKIILKFNSGKLRYRYVPNVGFFGTDRAEIVGKASPAA